MNKKNTGLIYGKLLKVLFVCDITKNNVVSNKKIHKNFKIK